MNKYRAKKTTVDGIEFDSKRDAARYRELKLMLKSGLISGLKMQVRYDLIPAQYIDGKCVERKVIYISDFEYDERGHHVVEDVKGVRTHDYVIKRKLMLWIHGVRIKEI